MKKIFLAMSLFALIIVNPIYASSNFNVSINNSIFTVKSAGVQVNGEMLNTEFKPYIRNGRTFVPIREITEKLGADVNWDNKNKSITINNEGKVIKMQIDSSTVFVDGKKVNVGKDQAPKLTSYKAPRAETKTMVPLRFISETFGYDVDWNNDKVVATISTFKSANLKDEKKSNVVKVSTANDNSKNNNSNNGLFYQSNQEKEETKKLENNLDKGKKEEVYNSLSLNMEDEQEKRVIKDKIQLNGKLRIVIDPGHGGKDSGAVGADSKTFEKDLNLEVAERLFSVLQNKNYDVIMTRSRDEYIKLVDRASVSNDNNADLFLSIHFNSADNESASGIEVLYASEKNIKIKDTVQKHFAQCLQNALVKETGAKNRGIINRPAIAVTSKTKNVAALVELGFISNPNELDKIKDSDYIDLLVRGIANGIDNYVKNYTE
ncbi:N-acetylmuramoyl-L-alanine amidase [Peptoniphilus sp.]|uniref:N-acetylmuramoyl-L-alanine amidase n=1 Tax=Peptoniphilus sp. TaxID=1971214 RepID=UPI003D9231B5